MFLKLKFSLIFKIGIAIAAQSVALAQTQQNCPPAPLPVEQAMEYIAKTPAKNAGFLWRIEKDGRTSWLYGTMHWMHIDYAKPGMQIMLGMRNTDVLAVEVNTYDAPSALPITSERLSFNLSSDQLARLHTAYQKDCLAMDPVQHLITPLLNTQASRKNLYWGYGPDARLMQIAKRTNKPIASLESFVIQAAVLRPQSQAEFDEQVNASLTEIETGQIQKKLSEIARAWQQNDWPHFLQYEQEMSINQPAFMRRLNDDRNKQMAQKIDALHSDGKRVFVAVGALHMTGQYSLPTLLQQKGYAVHFVPLKN
jgi:uncharacterized protein